MGCATSACLVHLPAPSVDFSRASVLFRPMARRRSDTVDARRGDLNGHHSIRGIALRVRRLRRALGWIAFDLCRDAVHDHCPVRPIPSSNGAARVRMVVLEALRIWECGDVEYAVDKPRLEGSHMNVPTRRDRRQTCHGLTIPKSDEFFRRHGPTSANEVFANCRSSGRRTAIDQILKPTDGGRCFPHVYGDILARCVRAGQRGGRLRLRAARRGRMLCWRRRESG